MFHNIIVLLPVASFDASARLTGALQGAIPGLLCESAGIY